MSAMFCECKSPDPRGPIVLSSYCLHQVRVCLSLSRLTNDVKIKQRCEELTMNFAARIGGKDDFDIVELRSDQQQPYARLGAKERGEYPLPRA